MSLTTPLLTSSPSPSNVVTVANTTVNIIFGFIPGGETELVTSTLNASPISSSRTMTTSEVSEPIRAVTTFKITTTGISQPFSTNTLTDIGLRTYLKLAFCAHTDYIKSLSVLESSTITIFPSLISTISFTSTTFSGTLITETLTTLPVEKLSSFSLTEIEIGQSSYSGKTSQNVLTSVDPPHTNQATGTSLHRGNSSHLLTILLPTLIVGLVIVCSVLWILCYKYKHLSQNRHRFYISSYPALIRRTQDDRHKVDSNNCNRDAQEYNLKEVSANTLTDGERSRSLLTTSRHSQPMVEGPQRQDGSSMPSYNDCEC